MVSRQEEVSGAYIGTFQWIFDATTDDTKAWDNFAQWLESGDGVYWISGRPGSGKSTLMRYIVEEPNTEDPCSGHGQDLMTF